jgi:adenylosuccinate lyase
MPHKRNPIKSERLTGMARLLRGNAMAAMENVALWHERDISHSSVERVVIPDSCILTHFMLVETTGLIKNLLVYPENMARNMNVYGGVVFSQRVLLALVERGLAGKRPTPLCNPVPTPPGTQTTATSVSWSVTTSG